MSDKPKLRFVEALPIETENGRMFALRDPSGISEEMVVVSGEALFLLQFFDGEHTRDEIRACYFKNFGAFLPEQKLRQLIDELGRQYYLEDKNFEEYKKALIREMLSQAARPSAHAGASYAAEPAKLRNDIDALYQAGAGALPTNGKLSKYKNGRAKHLSGAIVPHIDLRVGGSCYTHAYRKLAETAPADVYIILGTGHGGLKNCYSCLPMDFETPFGSAKHDPTFIETLSRKCTFDLFAEPLPHRAEHTIEFQVLFLQHLLGGKRDFTIVPILCSYAYLMLTDERFSRERKIVKNFTTALKQTIEYETKRGRKVCTIASVDFSHIGPRYGEAGAPDARFLQRVRKADHRLIEAIAAVDADRFVQVTEELEDRYRVCGFAPIHTLLVTTSAKSGELLKYEQGLVDDRKSVVTFASLVLQ